MALTGVQADGSVSGSGAIKYSQNDRCMGPRCTWRARPGRRTHRRRNVRTSHGGNFCLDCVCADVTQRNATQLGNASRNFAVINLANARQGVAARWVTCLAALRRHRCADGAIASPAAVLFVSAFFGIWLGPTRRDPVFRGTHDRYPRPPPPPPERKRTHS